MHQQRNDVVTLQCLSLIHIYHNALDIDMFLRIETELYLKRLIVGVFEKVYDCLLYTSRCV